MTQTPVDPARTRFMAITLLRVSGVALMLFGMGIIGTGLIEPRDLVGGVIFLVGLVDGLILPKLLARKWRTPPGP